MVPTGVILEFLSLAVLVLLVEPRTKKARLREYSALAQRCVHERPDYMNGEYVRASGIENEAKQCLYVLGSSSPSAGSLDRYEPTRESHNSRGQIRRRV